MGIVMSAAQPLTDPELAALVDRFYTRVRADEQLGPIFNGAVDDWPEHLRTLSKFWSSVMLGSGSYKGNPIAVHLRHVEAITPELFQRWLRPVARGHRREPAAGRRRRAAGQGRPDRRKPAGRPVVPPTPEVRRQLNFAGTSAPASAGRAIATFRRYGGEKTAENRCFFGRCGTRRPPP